MFYHHPGQDRQGLQLNQVGWGNKHRRCFIIVEKKYPILNKDPRRACLLSCPAEPALQGQSGRDQQFKNGFVTKICYESSTRITLVCADITAP